MRRQKSEKTYTVGYRITGKHLSSLEKRAARSGKVSIHEEARRILIERLENTEYDRVVEQGTRLQGDLESLSDELQGFRDDVKQALSWIVRRLNEIAESTAEEE